MMVFSLITDNILGQPGYLVSRVVTFVLFITDIDYEEGHIYIKYRHMVTVKLFPYQLCDTEAVRPL